MVFKGSALNILQYNTVMVLAFGLAASIGLMGTNWPFFFIASLAVMLPVLLLVTAVLAWLNRFSFDDERGEFRKPGGKRIPYGRVRSIHIAERSGVIDVFVKQGWMHLTSLVEAVPAGLGQRLHEELAARFPGRVRTRSRWSSFAPPLVILAVVVLLLAAAHLFLYQRYPQLRASLQRIEGEARKGTRPQPPTEFIEGLGFTPPAGYRFIEEQQGDLYFEDRRSKQRLKVVGGIQRTHLRDQAALFQYALGVRDHDDLLGLSYRARMGVIPLFLRTLDLAGLEEVAIYEIALPLHGYASQGRRDSTEETHVVITGEQGDQEVHFFFSGPTRLSEATLRTFLSGIQPVRPSGSAARAVRSGA